MALDSHMPPLRAVMFARHTPAPGRMAMPDICCDLIWVDERLWLGGPQTSVRPARHYGREVQVVNIDPLLARAWLGMPLSELTDQVVPADDLRARGAGALSEMFAAGGARNLVKPGPRAAGGDPRAAQAGALLRAGASVAAAAKSLGMSDRHLERAFRDWFGLAPKQYAEILRFRRAMNSANAGARLADAALEAGYADQPHFTRRTRALSGATPRALLGHVGNVQDMISIRPY